MNRGYGSLAHQRRGRRYKNTKQTIIKVLFKLHDMWLN